MTAKRWRAVFVLCELALLLAVPVLAYRGFAAVLDTTDGRVIDPELDPHEPGYEAFVEPTPTLAVLGVHDGGLSWAAMLALTGPGGAGGAVVLVPARTIVSRLGAAEATLVDAYAAGGAEAAGQGLAEILGAAAGEVVEVGDERLAQLVAPVAPLTVTNPDAVEGFGAGPVSVAAADTGPFLAAARPGVSDLSRLARHEQFWLAWLAAVGASDDPDVVPGETSSGIGRFVRGLAAGAVTIDVPPVTPEAAGPSGEDAERYRAAAFETFDLVEARIPFPAAASPGARTRVRVLDGVGADGLALRAARDVVDAEGQIVVIGNADAFDVATTRVVYFDEPFAAGAERIAERLGVDAERLEGVNPDESVHVTVVVGADLLSAYGLSERTTTTNGDDPG